MLIYTPVILFVVFCKQCIQFHTDQFIPTGLMLIIIVTLIKLIKFSIDYTAVIYSDL